VYRHFPTRQDLMAAILEWVNERAGTQRATTADELVATVRRVFATFDDVAPVVRELLLAPEGRDARLADNDARRAAALGVVDHAAAGLDGPTARRVAAVVQLLTSAAAWQSLRDYWDMDGAEAAETVAVALTMILESAARRTTEEPPTGPARKRVPRPSASKGGPR
jgi:AcrR family transcriptional regulator